MSRQHAPVALAVSLFVTLGLTSCGDATTTAGSTGRPAVQGLDRLPSPDPLPPLGRFARAEHGVGEAERLLDTGALAAASQALDDALVLDPLNRRARIVRGQILLREGRAADALLSFEAARQMLADVLVLEWIGLAHLARRDEVLAADSGAVDRAVECAAAARAAFEQVLRLDSSNVNSRHNLGYSARLAGRLDESVAVLTALVAEQPERVRTLYELGVSLQAAGRLDEAREAFQRLLAIQPEHGSARRALEGLGG